MHHADDKPGLPPAVTSRTWFPPSRRITARWRRLRNYFLTGLILVGPIYITINLTWWFVNWVDDAMRPFIPVGLRAETYLPFKVPGYGVIIALFALTLLGFLTANLVGRTLVEFSENLLNRMPIVRPIYKTMKQIFETLFSKSGPGFGKVALAEFPTGMWSVVFLASPPSAEIASRLPGKDYVSCFLPCTPNPTTGFFLLCAAQPGDRARHHGRAGDDADHVGRHGAAQRRRAEEARERWSRTAAPPSCRFRLRHRLPTAAGGLRR